MNVKKISKWLLGVVMMSLLIAGFILWRHTAQNETTQAKTNNSTIDKSVEKSPPAEVSNFYNPIASEGADPWVLKHTDGYYYSTRTTGGSISIWKSKTLTGIDGGEKKTVWTPPPSGPNSKNIWAPEIHWLNGKWYIYYAADGGKGTGHHMYVLESTTSDALGPYVSKGQITDRTNKRAIDGTVLKKEDGSLYFIWSGWEGEADDGQNLYIAAMSNPYTITGDRVEISRPTYPWERNGLINEGPEVVFKNNKIFIIYAASGSWTDDYCLGMLSTDINSEVLQPSSWKKSDKPVFSKANGVYGPGHAAFTKSPDGTEDWIVYHAAKYKGGGWNRNIRMQKYTWNADGTPNFGTPISVDTPVTKPSGEPNRMRYEAEQASLNPAAVASHSSASAGKKAGFANDSSNSGLEFSVYAQSDGPYNMSIRFGNGATGKVVNSTYNVSVNGGAATAVQFVNQKVWNNWSTSVMKVNLHAGTNTIRFSKVMTFAEFDFIDIFPY